MPEIDLGYVKGPKGDPGEPGRDGTDGTPGAPGAPGADGKSAYQYAKEGGFVGTEEQFYTALAEVVLKMNKVIPRKVDTIATLSAAGQAQDSGKTLADYYTKGETVAKGDVYTKSEVYSKTEADGKFAGTDAFYTKAQTMTSSTGQLFGSNVTTPDAAFQAIKTLIDAAQNTANDGIARAKLAVGSYVGTGVLTNRITLGFRAKFLIIFDGGSVNIHPSSPSSIFWGGATSVSQPRVINFAVDASGISITTTKDDPGHGDRLYAYYVMNEKGAKYGYMGVG